MECYRIENATAIGGQRLVGVDMSSYPIKKGNCFDVKVGEEYVGIVNFGAENLRELVKRGLTWPIKIKRLASNVGLIVDERIPDHWYQDRYCEVCTPEAFLNHFQLMRRERAVARGDREILPGGYVRSRIGPNPVFDYVGEKKIDFKNWHFKIETEVVQQFGDDGKPL